MAFTSAACASARVSPGRMRQLTIASADVGSTLSCGAPLSIVVTQVVRRFALYDGSFERTASSAGEMRGAEAMA